MQVNADRMQALLAAVRQQQQQQQQAQQSAALGPNVQEVAGTMRQPGGSIRTHPIAAPIAAPVAPVQAVQQPAQVPAQAAPAASPLAGAPGRYQRMAEQHGADYAANRWQQFQDKKLPGQQIQPVSANVNGPRRAALVSAVRGAAQPAPGGFPTKPMPYAPEAVRRAVPKPGLTSVPPLDWAKPKPGGGGGGAVPARDPVMRGKPRRPREF